MLVSGLVTSLCVAAAAVVTVVIVRYKHNAYCRYARTTFSQSYVSYLSTLPH